MANHRECSRVHSLPELQETLDASCRTFELNVLDFDHVVCDESHVSPLIACSSRAEFRELIQQRGVPLTPQPLSHVGVYGPET